MRKEYFYKIKERKQTLEQLIQEYPKKDELFKEIHLKQETFFRKFEEGKYNISVIRIMQERLNLSNEQLSFIFFGEEKYTEEMKAKDFEFMRSQANNQSNDFKKFIEDLIQILEKANTIQQRDYIFNQIKSI